MSRIKMLKKEAQVALPNSGETYIAEDGTVSMVLDDHHDEHYEPSEQEVKEYAEWLGMSLPEDSELLWIAKEGLKAPLPKEWKPCKTDTGEVYYFNFKTGDSIWDHPMDEHFKNKFKTEKERLKKAKETGQAVADPLAKLASRNNIIFTEQGVVKHEVQVSPVTTPRSAAGSTDERAATTPVSTTAVSKSASSQFSKADPAPMSTTAAPAASKATAATTGPSSSSSYATAIPSISSKSAVAAAAATHEDLPESPRLVSEAEKILQDRVRQEAEADHKKQVEILEQQFNQQSAAARRAHEDEVAEQKRQAHVNKRSQIDKLEERFHDELEQQQKNIDAKGKREIGRDEAEIENLRQKVRDVQATANQRLEKEIADMERRTRDAVQQKVVEIESEIASIRMRHAKAQMEAVEQETQRLELELNRSSVEAKEKTSQDYESRTTELRRQHLETLERLREEHRKEMEEETRRAASVRGGDASSMAAEVRRKQADEVAAIQRKLSDDIQALRASEQQNHQLLRQQLESEIALLLRQGGASSSDAQTLAAIDADADARIRVINDQNTRDHEAWLQAATALRAQRLAQIASEGAQGGGAPSVNANFSAAAYEQETASLVAAAQRRHAAEEEDLRTKLAHERALAQQGNLQAAIQSAVDRDFDAFVRETTAMRAEEEATYQRSKQDAEEKHRQSMAAYEAKVSAARGAPPPTSVHHVTIPASAASVRAAAASTVEVAIQASKQRAEERLRDRMRALRQELDAAHAKRMAELVDSLAAEEQKLRSDINAELAAADAYDASVAANVAVVPNAAPTGISTPQVGIPRDHLDQQLLAVRAEYASRETAIREEFSERIASLQSQLTTLRSAIAAARLKLHTQQQQLTAGPQLASGDGLPPRSTTPHVQPHQAPLPKFASPSPQPSHSSGGGAWMDPTLQFLQEQQKSAIQRHEMLASARSDVWRSGELPHTSGTRNAALHDANHSPRRTNTRQSVDPAAAAPELSAQIVMALHSLNSKLERLADRVDHIATQGPTSHPAAAQGGQKQSSAEPMAALDEPQRGRRRDEKRSHRQNGADAALRGSPPHSKSKKTNDRRSSSADLSAKWSHILQKVSAAPAPTTTISGKSKHHQPSYEGALRHYLHAD